MKMIPTNVGIIQRLRGIYREKSVQTKRVVRPFVLLVTIVKGQIMTKKTSKIVVQQNYGIQQLNDFEESLLGFLEQHNLPTESILVPVQQRAIVFNNIESVLNELDDAHIEKSVYISKFFAAVASGLFDAALNYLWDETIFELRRRVAQYDISYFFDSAVKNAEKRKRLKTEDDLVRLDDNELISGAREIELISEIGFRHLDNIRYMRNWASAAHPNQNELTGLQLISWLETCIKEVISLPLSNVAIEIKQLLANIKSNSIPQDEAKQIGGFFLNLTQDQVNSLAAGFFGIYTRSDTITQTRENIHRLLPFLWGRVDEEARQNFGIRYGKFVANNAQDERELARAFLQTVSAESYMPESIRTVEIQIAIDDLLEAHRGFNNFHNEPPFARQLQRLVGDEGKIPSEISNSYVVALVEVFLTNGNGVSWAAEPVYKSLLNNFDSTQAARAVLSFANETISSSLQFRLCQQKYRELLEMMKIKISAPTIKELIEEIEAYRGSLSNMKNDQRLAPKIRNLFKIMA